METEHKRIEVSIKNVVINGDYKFIEIFPLKGYEISEDKYPAIKEAIEIVLNNENVNPQPPVEVSQFDIQRFALNYAIGNHTDKNTLTTVEQRNDVSVAKKAFIAGYNFKHFKPELIEKAREEFRIDHTTGLDVMAKSMPIPPTTSTQQGYTGKEYGAEEPEEQKEQLTDKEKALYIVSKCRAMVAEDELKLIHLSLRYWEDGHPIDISVSMAAQFISDHETK